MGQGGGVKEVRLRKIGKSDRVHSPALITEAQCASIGELHEARQVQEPASGPGVRNLLTGANIGRIERIRKRAKGKAEVVVDRVGPAEGTGREQRPRIFDVKVAGFVVVERLHAGLQADGIAGSRHADRRRAARSIFVGAEETIEPINPPCAIGERRLVGDDIDRTRERV